MWTVLLGMAAAAEVAIVASTASGGVGSGRYELGVPPELVALGVADVRAVHGAMVYEREALLAVDGQEAAVSAYLDAPGACGDAVPVAIREGRDGVTVTWEAEATGEVGARRCEGPAGDVWWVGAGEPSGHWANFEHRLALQVDLASGGEPAWVLGRPHREFARRVALIEALADGALFVDGGNFVDGASTVRWGELSLHRPLGFDTLRRLAPAALVPGAQELAGGPSGFLAEAEGLPYVAANWEADSEVLQLPSHVVVAVGRVRVAFVGVIDPQVAEHNPALAEQGVTLGDPIAAAQQVVARLKAADRADVVVLLCDGSQPLLRALQRGVRHADVLLGDPGPSVDRLDTVHYELQAPYAADDRAALTLPADGVAYVVLDMEEGRLDGARVRPARITAEIDPDEATMARITEVRRRVYPDVDRPLLPAPPEGPLERYRDEDWHKLLCEAVLASSGADLALLPSLGGAPPVPGALTEKVVLDTLARLDRVEVHEVLGDRLPRLLDKAVQGVPVSCGAPLGSSSPTVGGRSVDTQRVYRVATTDGLLTGQVSGWFAEARSTALLDQPTVDPTPRTLQRAVRDGLRQALEADDVEGILARSFTDQRPLWLFRVTRLGLSAVGFQGVERDVYSEVPETLATSPSSLTLLGDLDSGLEYSDRHVAWDLRQRLTYTRLASEGVVSEPADDLRLSSSLTLPGASFDLGPTWAPYTELLLDSELTAVEDEEGVVQPHQADASLTLGLSTSAGVLSRLRVGAFGLRDLSVLEKPWETGGRLEVATSVSLGAGLSWASSVDAFVFADTPTADASDLRFKALVDTRLTLPLARWLSIAPYGQVFAFSGRLPETADPAAAYTVGTALDLAGAFRL